jgi:hypothetical protein
MSQPEPKETLSTISPSQVPHVKELLLKQYDTLRKEIEFFIAEANTLGYHGALGTGAIWAAVFSNFVDKNIPLAAFFIPFILALIFSMRNYNV